MKKWNGLPVHYNIGGGVGNYPTFIMSTLKVLYPLDLTGTLPENLLDDGTHVLDAYKWRFFAFNNGPAFASSVVIKKAGSTTPLRRGVDYELFHLDAKLTKLTGGQEIVSVVGILSTNLGTSFTAKAQFVGAQWLDNAYKIKAAIESLKLTDRSLDAADVIGMPDYWLPADHYTDHIDVFGYEYLIDLILQLGDALNRTADGMLDSVLKRLEALKAAFEANLDNHIKNVNNPHKLNYTHLNVYSKANIDAMVAIIEARIATQDGRFPALYQRVASITTQLNNIATTLSTLNTEIANLSADVSGFDSQIDKINGDIVAINQAYNVIEADIVKLEAEDVRLKGLIAKNKTEIGKLRTADASITAKIDALYQKDATQVTAIATTKADLDNRLAVLTTKLNTLSDKYNDLNEDFKAHRKLYDTAVANINTFQQWINAHNVNHDSNYAHGNIALLHNQLEQAIANFRVGVEGVGLRSKSNVLDVPIRTTYIAIATGIGPHRGTGGAYTKRHRLYDGSFPVVSADIATRDVNWCDGNLIYNVPFTFTNSNLDIGVRLNEGDGIVTGFQVLGARAASNARLSVPPKK